MNLHLTLWHNKNKTLRLVIRDAAPQVIITRRPPSRSNFASGVLPQQFAGLMAPSGFGNGTDPDLDRKEEGVTFWCCHFSATGPIGHNVYHKPVTVYLRKEALLIPTDWQSLTVTFSVFLALSL